MWYEFVFHYELVNSDCALSLSHSFLVTAPSRKEPCAAANLCDVVIGEHLQRLCGGAVEQMRD